MSLDAYKIAVKIALTENVTRGLMAMAPHFTAANMGAKELEARLASIGKLTMLGGAAMGVGALGFKMLEKPIEAAKAYQQEMGKLSAQGIGDVALAQADKFARAQKIIGASSTDTMRMLAETNSILRDPHEAEMVTPMLLKMKFGIESVMGNGHGAKMEQQFMSALKVGELRGAVTNRETGEFSYEKLKQTMDFMTRAYTASNGLVKPTDYLAMIKTGGVAAKGLNDQMFYFGLMHMMQETGGSRVGTSLMSGFQNMYMGRTTQQVAELMAQDGLLDKAKIHYGKTGHITKLDPGAIEQAELFKTDQFRYMNEVILPKLRKMGVKEGDEMQLAIAKLFSNRTASNLWTSMYMERFNIQKHMDSAKNSLGVDDLAIQGAQQYQGKQIILGKAWDNFMLALGRDGGVIDAATFMLEKFAKAIELVTDIARTHPTFTKLVIAATAVVSALSFLGGALLILKATLGAFSLLNISGIATALGSGVGLSGSIAALVTPVGLAVAGIVALGVAIYGIAKLLDRFGFKDWEKSPITTNLKDRLKSLEGGKVDDIKLWGQSDSLVRTGSDSKDSKPTTVQLVLKDGGRVLAEVVSSVQSSKLLNAFSAGSYDNQIHQPLLSQK